MTGPQIFVVREVRAQLLLVAVLEAFIPGNGRGMEGLHVLWELAVICKEPPIPFLPIWEVDAAGSKWLRWSHRKPVLGCHISLEQFALAP